MGMMETRIVQVENSPEAINRSNDVWGIFGWTVLSVQITHSQNTKTYTKGILDYYSGDKTVETTTINYATITYQRDKDMPNYKRLAALQAEAESLVNEEVKPAVFEKPKIMSKKNYWIAFGLYVVGAMPISMYAGANGKRAEDLIIFALILPVVYLIFTYNSGHKRLQTEFGNVEQRREQEAVRCENRKREIANRLDEIETEARKLTA